MSSSTTAPVPVLAIACGGTGGHFYPGVSIAREFKRRGGRPVLFIGGHHISDQLRIAADLGLEAVNSPTIRPPGNPLLWPVFAAQLWGCVRANRRLLRQSGCQGALVMGSFASVPLGLAARRQGLPLFCHEGNSCLGRANRLLSRRARLLFLSFPLSRGERTRAPQRLVGMPIRSQLRVASERPVDAALRAELCADLCLSPNLPILLAFGGSQGARFLNDLLLRTAGILGKEKQHFQLVHLTGSSQFEDYAQAYRQIGLRACVRQHERHMEKLYQVADLVLARAGASTIFELALFSKPALLVPLPSAMDDHQTANAQIVVDQQAGILLPQRDLTEEVLRNYLVQWLEDPASYRLMGERMRQLARPHAAADIVDELSALMGGQPLARQQGGG